jgi:P27 family predicted phage terminase small subunit
MTKAPAHLTAATRRWFETIAAEYELGTHHERILQAASESWDRYQQARQALATEGLTVTDKHGKAWPHPAVAIERDSRVAFLRALRELALDVGPPDTRPPVRPGGSIH